MNPRRKSRLTYAAKALLATAIVASICSAIVPYRNELSRLAEVNWNFLVLGVFCCLTYRIANAHGWCLVLRAIDQQLPPLLAIRVWLTSEACRWLPGSVWSYGTRAYQARRYGVATVPAGASLFLEVILTLAAWLTTAAVGLIVYRSEFGNLLERHAVSTFAVGTLALVAAFTTAALACKPICRWLSTKFKGIHEQLGSLRQVKPKARRTAETLAYYVVMNSFNGVACYFTLRAVAIDSDVPMLAVIAANSAAWLVGFFALIAPGGLVVREGTFAALLAAWLPVEQAIVVAIVWRMVQIGVEIACMIPAGLPISVPSRRTVESIA